MIRSLRISGSRFAPYLILVTIILFIAQYFLQNIIAGKSLQLVNMIIILTILITILKRPLNGLLILPFVSYLMPESIRIFGNSPGLILSSVTLFSLLIHTSTGRLKPNISGLWVLISLILLNVYNISPNWVIVFFQGFMPFLIFSLFY